MKTVPSLVLAAVGLAALAVPLRAAETNLVASLKNDLVTPSEGKRLKKFDDTTLSNVKYLGIYYSAAWCPPCRAFTPDLVSWYNQNKKDNPHFELVFVSSDRSEDAMAGYMKEYKMAFPGLEFGKKAGKHPVAQFSGQGIPCLVLVDNTGKVLSHSYEGENYVGPRKVLADMDKILKENPAGAPGASPTAATKPAPGGSSSFDDFFKKKPAGQ